MKHLIFTQLQCPEYTKERISLTASITARSGLCSVSGLSFLKTKSAEPDYVLKTFLPSMRRSIIMPQLTQHN